MPDHRPRKRERERERERGGRHPTTRFCRCTTGPHLRPRRRLRHQTAYTSNIHHAPSRQLCACAATATLSRPAPLVPPSAAAVRDGKPAVVIPDWLPFALAPSRRGALHTPRPADFDLFVLALQSPEMRKARVRRGSRFAAIVRRAGKSARRVGQDCPRYRISFATDRHDHRRRVSR